MNKLKEPFTKMNLLPTRFRLLRRFHHQQRIKILDVGAGSHSASITKKWFPLCEYHGIDRIRNYRNTENDLKNMDVFYEMDVTLLNYSNIPDNYFDVIIMSHIIEHLHNGNEVILNFISKLKRGGLFYIEFPSVRSLSLPSMEGTLNFYDDKTHCRVYTREEVESILTPQKCKIVYSNVRRDWTRILLTPLLMFHSFIQNGHLVGSVFWDITGFADIVIAQKE